MQANQEIESDMPIPSSSRNLDMDVKSNVLEPEIKKKKSMKDLSTEASTSKVMN